MAAKIFVDRLAMPVGEDDSPCLDTGCRQFALKAEAREDGDSVRKQIDADPERSDVLHGFEDGHLATRLVERKRRRQAADTRSRDDHPVAR